MRTRRLLHLTFAAAFAALAMALGASGCDINPQPLPPGASGFNSPGEDAGYGGVPTAADGGTLSSADASPPATGPSDDGGGDAQGSSGGGDADAGDASDGGEDATDGGEDAADAAMDAEDAG